MKIPLKYGLIATAGVAAWVLITRSLITDPKSAVHTLGSPIFFNVFHFAAISVIYALTISLFFVGVIAVVGTKWLASEPTAGEMPMSRVMIGAFIGLFVGALIFGLIYSTLISFYLAKRRSEEP